MIFGCYITRSGEGFNTQDHRCFLAGGFWKWRKRLKIGYSPEMDLRIGKTTKILISKFFKKYDYKPKHEKNSNSKNEVKNRLGPHSINSYEHFKFSRILQIFTGRHTWEDRRKIVTSSTSAMLKITPTRLTQTSDPFLPFVVQRKPPKRSRAEGASWLSW